ncbi:beta-ketoacyl synthase chain length factor [Sphingosinicellaceae bacterium A1X5R2]|nr:beta-ketoacyl synthase chain length factor [Pedomonas mirosovicensis]
MPDVGFLPPLQRRRMSRLSRMALTVAHDCLEAATAQPALVFCTRYGEYERTYGLLQDLADGEALSPASFSVSVHNTAAGLCSIHEGLAGYSTAISAGRETLEHGFLDCATLLNTGEADEALLVFHDEPLPEVYGRPEPGFPGGLALALLLRRAGQGGDELALAWREKAGDEAQNLPEPEPCAITQAGNVLRLLTRRADRCGHEGDRLRWIWSYHAAA